MSMKNIDLLKEILTTDREYWVVRKPNQAKIHGAVEDISPDILFIAIPYEIERGMRHEDIKLIQAERLHNTICLTNIHLTDSYSPFQIGIKIGDFDRGFPINAKYARRFISEAWALNSNNICEYEELMRSIEVDEQNKATEEVR